MRRLVTLCVVVLVLASACAGGEAQSVRGTVTATPLPDSETPATPSPSPSPSTPSPSPTESGPRAPTDADRARFVAEYQPDGAANLRDVAVDLDGDGQAELVFAYVAGGVSRVDVAGWTGTEYVVVEEVRGGPADELTDLQVRDLNATVVPEVAVLQTVGGAGESASLWTAEPGGRLRALVAEGGCFDASNTYGDTGVRISDRDGDGLAEIRAVCEEPDTPEPLWPTDVYLWSGLTYRCDHRETADGQQAPCDSEIPPPESPGGGDSEPSGTNPPASEDPG